MNNKWLPAASSTRTFWALTSALLPLCGLLAHHASRVMDAPVSTSVSTADWMPLNQPLLRAQRLGKLFAFLGDPCLSGPMFFYQKQFSPFSPFYRWATGKNPSLIEEGRMSFWIRCLLHPGLGRKEARVHIPFPKPNTWSNNSSASEQGFQSLSHPFNFPPHLPSLKE